MPAQTETLPKQETENKSEKNDLIFAFDLGSASIGECVRQGSEIKHIDTLLMPGDFASIKEQATRRRQWRTRLAHKARENWWRIQAQRAGIEVLHSQRPTKENSNVKPDPRLLKEFPNKNDGGTIYTSCLLRIALLQGRKLKGWQVYKAVRNALQHRGYDNNIPWKRGYSANAEDEKSKKQKDDEAKNVEAVNRYQRFLDEKLDKKYHYPCYFEAYRMGIWDPKDPENLSNIKGYRPPARNKDTEKETYVVARHLVEQELKELIKQASKQFDELRGKEHEIIYGPGKMQYATYIECEKCQNHKNGKCADDKKAECSKNRKFRGEEWLWHWVNMPEYENKKLTTQEKTKLSQTPLLSLVGQKIPRFENRAINKCALMPRFNVCKAEDMLNREIVFLLKLKNMRYMYGDNANCALTPQQIQFLFEKYKSRLEETNKSGKLLMTIKGNEWKKYVKEDLNALINPVHNKIEPPDKSGRSRFCRPAMEILKRLILEGKNPHDFHKELISATPRRGFVTDDYKFLLDMENEWHSIAVSDRRMQETLFTPQQREEKINQLINKILHPIVRHRLKLFKKRLEELSQKFGSPGRVVLEFAREDNNSLYGKKKKDKYIKENNENRKIKDEAVQNLLDNKIPIKENLTRMILYLEQGGRDPYSGQTLKVGAIENYEIDHIVPRSMEGPDAMFNKVLTDRNQEKGDKTPYQWLYGTDEWDKFHRNVMDMYGGKDKFKKKTKLLLSKNAEELAEKYSQLAATAWLEKVAAHIAALYFGWPSQVKGKNRYVYVINGAITAKFRRQYGLDIFLHPDIKSKKEFYELVKSDKLAEKNRNNPRHHALDALVISYAYNPHYVKEKDKFILPNFKPQIAEDALKRVYPKQIAYPKAKLAETIYGLRRIINDKGKEEIYAVTRSFTGSTQNGASILHYYNFAKAKKLINKIIDKKTKTEMGDALKNCTDTQEWKTFLDDYRKKTGIKKITVKVSDKPIKSADVDEGKKLYGIYKDFNKNTDTSRKQLFTDKKEHKGQLVCQMQNGKWEVVPVYVYDSLYRKTYETKNATDKQGNKKYKQVLFFRSQDLVELREDITNKNINKGVYKLITLKSRGTAKLKSIDELLEISSSINDFLNQGKMCHFKGEVLK